MWCLTRFPRIVLILGLMVVTAAAQDAPPAAKTSSATGKWLAEQDQQWQATYQRDVQSPFDKAVADLKKQYLAALEAMIAAAARDARLDDAVALRTERDRVTAGGDIAAGDAAAPAGLQAARVGFVKNLAQLAMDRAAKAKTLHARYDALLAQNQTALTQRQRFDEALEIKAWRERLSTEWLSPTAVASPVRAPSTTVTAPPPVPPSLAITSTARPAERMDIYISGSNGITLYINNKEALTGGNRDKATKIRVGLREGDILAVKNADRWDINSFWMSCISSNDQFLFESTDKWTSYLPADEKKWWNTKTAKEQQPAAFAPDKQEYVDLVKKAMKETPLHHGAQPIRSTLRLEGSRATFLYYIVTRADLLPKPDPAGATK